MQQHEELEAKEKYDSEPTYKEGELGTKDEQIFNDKAILSIKDLTGGNLNEYG